MAYYVVSGLINCLTSLLLGAYLFLRGWNRHAPTRVFGLWCLSVGGWSFGYYFWQLARTQVSALFWAKVLMFSAIVIPVLILHFTAQFLNLFSQKRRLIVSYYLVSLVYLATDVWTNTFISGVERELFFPYWPKPGLLFHPYLAMFLASVAYSHYLLWRAMRSASGLRRTQIQYVFWGTLIAFTGGSTNFPLWYNIPIPPIGNGLVIVYVACITYAIVRYRLMEINVAVTRATVFTVVYTLLLGLPLIGALAWQPYLERLLGTRWWIWLWLVGAALATAAHYMNLFLQRQAEARLLREQRHYQTTLLNAAKGMTQIRDLQHLLSLIVHMLTRSMKLTHAGVFMEEGRSGQYVLQASRDRDALVKGLALDSDDVLMTWLKKEQAPLVSEEIRQMVNGTVSPANLEATLKRIGASVVVPSFAEDQLIGFLVLGDKKTGQMYSQDDLNTLQTLANQSALAIQNAQFYSELQTKTAELIHESKLKSMGKMASGMAHQFNNRLACLAMEASSALEMIVPKLRSPGLPDSERHALVELLERALGSIGEESIKGKQIVKTMLEFSKPTTDLVLISLHDIVQGGLKMVGLKQDLHQVHVYTDVPAERPYVHVNLSQLQDVFFNLLDNACDAIRWKTDHLKRGALQLPESDLPYQGKIAVIAKCSTDHRQFLITVADSGIGMTPEDREKLFLPFHTNKGTAEKGTGLGLFVIREMIKKHGGDIRLEKSEFGKGTTFLIELPIPNEERQWPTSRS